MIKFLIRTVTSFIMQPRVVVCLMLLIVSYTTLAQGPGPNVGRRRGSRIIDDTTKSVYGFKTSRYFYESEVFFNREIIKPIDTAIHNYHRFTFLQRYNNLYQDLGNIGTSSRPIFYQAPDIIGASAGHQSFDLYWFTEKIKYYDTKSPYSYMRVILGGKGRSMTNISYSRNINPRWNFGFNYRGMFIDKQILRSGKGDRNVKTTYYDAFTTYQSKDSTYRIFANFQRHHYVAREQGGVVSDSTSLKELFYVNAQPHLTTAESRERRISIHVFQQYNLFKKGIQVYHILDSYRQANYFYDKSLDTLYFPFVAIDSALVKDKTNFRSMRNEVGFKGNLSKLFYNGYYAIRQYEMDYKYYTRNETTVPQKGTEHYLGGRMSLVLDSIGELTALAEIEKNGNFKIEASLKSPWFDASLKQLQYSPGFLYQANLASHSAWDNSMGATLSTQLNGNLHYTSRVFKLSPGLTLTRLNNYAYYKYDDATYPGTSEKYIDRVRPVQSSGTQVIASPEVNMRLTMLRHIDLTGQIIYTSLLKNDDGAMSIPDLFINGQLAYSNIFVHGNMDMQVGVDLHYNSAYYAWGYAPSIQQFYRQSFFKTPEFPIIDAFFNIKIKRGRVFVKYNNVVQAFTKSGYLPTPFYPGQRPVIDFGFDLFFFD